jgi:hypothetical protein
VLGPPIFSGNVEIEYCAQLCHDRKFPLAGVEDGYQCICGTKVNQGTKLIPTGCKQACRGNPKEHCGGQFQIGVFSFNCSGAPVGPTPSPTQPPPCTTFNDEQCSELFNPCLNQSLPYHTMP